MKKFFSIFVVVLPALLLSDWEHLFKDNENPAVAYNVHVMTGDLQLTFEDHVVEGAIPINVIRTYSSAGCKERVYNEEFDLREIENVRQFEGGWHFFPHLQLLVDPRRDATKDLYAYLQEPSGEMISFKFFEEKDDVMILAPEKKAGAGFGVISGRLNSNNHRIYINYKTGDATVLLANGGKRVYKGESRRFLDKISDWGIHKFERKLRYYLLQEEISPSGQRTFFKYDDTNETENVYISQCNPSNTKTYASIKIRDLKYKSPFSIEITTSDQTPISYEGWSFKDQEYLSQIKISGKPTEMLSYIKTRKGLGASLETISVLDKEKLHVEYYRPPSKKESKTWAEKPNKKPFEIDRVKVIFQEGTQVAAFAYAPGVTEVRDVNQTLTRYHYAKQELNLIEYFDENDELYSSQKFFWKEGNLIAKVMCNNRGEPLFSKTFAYDLYGNIVQETLYGNLKGENEGPFLFGEDGALEGSDHYIKTYEYDPVSHLLIWEKEEEGLSYHYTYLEGTDLVLIKTVFQGDNKLITQEFIYDEDRLLIKEITDDGAFRTEKIYQRDPETGMVTAMESNEMRIVYKYSPQRQIIAENVFDRDGAYRYSNHYQYDLAGNLIYETTPCGSKNKYEYDPFGRVTKQKKVGFSEVHITYDAKSRPIAWTSAFKTNRVTYDAKGLVSSKVDCFGNSTDYAYYAFGRCVLTTFPLVKDEGGNPYRPTLENAYDAIGNVTLHKNSKGEIKQISYNLFGQPTNEIFPDGSTIRHFYNKNGTLKETICQDGSRIEYSYDSFHRMISRKTALKEEKWIYSPTQLLSYTDPQGLTTVYSYDAYGRKIAEKTFDRKTTYAYDPLGFLQTTTRGDVVYTQIHDEEGRVIQEDENGENCTEYTYDEEGRKIKILKVTSQGEAIDQIEYNQEGQVIRHIDPNGAVTEIFYQDKSKTVIDPLKNQTIKTQDALNRLIQTETKNPEGHTVSIEQNFYDPSGNLARKVTHVYEEDQFVRTSEVIWKYDFRGHVLQEMQSEKITQNEYDLLGRLIKRTLPNGTILINSYDQEGRLLELFSSDGTIHYQYQYELGQDPVKVEDKVHNTILERRYSPFGELVSETNQHKLAFKWEYDSLGREKLFILPDNSQIAYTYRGKHMIAIKRLSSKKELLYEHIYDAFDLNGHVTEESLIHNLGKVKTQHDLLERPNSVQSSYHTLGRSHNSLGLVIASESSLSGNKTYEYDAMHQLIKEGEREYHFDSLGNPTDASINEYNQLTTHFLYDANGNPTKRLNNDIEYQYDALNRLISIVDKKRKVEFLYDSYSRLTAKVISQNGKEVERKYYLDDREYEIVSVDEKGVILDLKVLGLGLEEDIGSAVAIELKGVVYAPLHDFQGNVVALLSAKGKILATCQYNAFGEQDREDFLTPWGFSSKRKEEGLIYFGKRFYDSAHGRWLTPDPLGFVDSSNIYLYTFNSPLNRLDLFGLSVTPPPKGIYIRPWNEVSDRYSAPVNRTPKTLRAYAILANNSLPPVIDCVVISGFIHHINFTPMEMIFNRCNLLDHMNTLVPSEQGGKIGLITAQNGINTSFKEFTLNCESIMSNVPEGTTFFGFHNRSEGANKDVTRAMILERAQRQMTDNVLVTGQALSLTIDGLRSVESEAYWLHVPHSEAGILFNLGITMLDDIQRKFMQNWLYVFAVAPAEPTCKLDCFSALSIYSDKDWITGWGAEKYKDNQDYDIRVIKCQSKLRERTGGIADHAFLGTTYRKAVHYEIEGLRKRRGFYDSRKR